MDRSVCVRGESHRRRTKAAAARTLKRFRGVGGQQQRHTQFLWLEILACRALSGTLAAEEHKHVTYLAHTCVTKLTNPSQAWPQGLHMNCYNCVCMCFGASLSEFMSQQPSKEIDQTVGKSASHLITAIKKSNCNGEQDQVQG